jgi:hypothetical protein
MAKPLAVTREQVIAYRVAAQGLHRDARSVGRLGVLAIGVQEAMGHPATLAFAARLPADTAVTPDSVAMGPGTRLALTWSLRGAPHVHRRADLDSLATAVYPLSEADAAGRLNETGPSVQRRGIAALEQFAIAVREMRAVVRSPTDKGAASTQVTKRIPAAMRRECRACKTSHISDSAMRVAALPAGLEIEPGTSPPVLLPRTGAKLPDKPDPKALADFARAYLRFLGPATVAEFAGYLEARRSDVAQHWPADLAEVTVDGKPAYLSDSELAALRKPPAPDLVRLLGPFDPYLQARDRQLIVPDTSVHKALWPVLGRPGVLFADGEVAGLWRTKTAGKKLTITVEAFGAARPAVWKAVDAEAERVAAARGATDVRVKQVG